MIAAKKNFMGSLFSIPNAVLEEDILDLNPTNYDCNNIMVSNFNAKLK